MRFMKRLFIPVILLLAAVALFVRANGPDDQYIQIYNLIQEGDQLASTGQPGLAREKYLEAQTGLKKLQIAHPDSNATVIQFRLSYLAEKLSTSAREKAAPPLLEKPSPGKKPSGAKQPSTADEKNDQLSVLREQIHQLQAEKGILEAKLKEALSAQPAAVDPRELGKAEQRIKFLEKERELLRVSLDQEQAKQAKAASPLGGEDLKKALAEANGRLAREKEASVALAREKEILEARLQATVKDADVGKALRVENEGLKKQLADSRPNAPATAGSNSKLESELTAAKAMAQTNAILVARLQSELKTIQEEKNALEKSKRELESKLSTAAPSAPKSTGSQTDRVKRVETERDELLRKLNETTKQLYENKARAEAVQGKQDSTQLATLRARLEVLEANKVPFTSEELALFKKSEVTASKVDPKAKPDTKSGKKLSREWPKGAAPLLADAERAFAARRYDEAEKKYQQLLKLDDKNVLTLGNLAAIQLQQNRVDEAEATLKRALAEDANDLHAVQLWGYLKFRQEKFDEALDSLSRAAQIDPQNPEVQNYLGITLSHKGQRGAAETALRKAIQIAPSFGDAHQNLAVIYATQQPPFKELARWHYQKSLACGNPQNPDLEKMIESAQASPEKK